MSNRSTLPMQAYCPACGVPALVFKRSSQLVCESCFRPEPSEGSGVSGRNLSPVDGAGDGGEVDPAPLSSLGLPANPSGDIPSSVKESGGVRHRVPGPFDVPCATCGGSGMSVNRPDAATDLTPGYTLCPSCGGVASRWSAT